MPWIILTLAGLFEIGWAIGLKYTDGFTRLWPTVGTVVSMAISLGLLGIAMKSLPVGTAYAVWVGVGAVGTAILGIVLLGEPANAGRMLSLGLIIAGIIGLKLASSKFAASGGALPRERRCPRLRRRRFDSSVAGTAFAAPLRGRSKAAAFCGRRHATRLRYGLPGGAALWAKSRRRPKAGGHSPKGLLRPARSARPKKRRVIAAKTRCWRSCRRVRRCARRRRRRSGPRSG